MSHVVLLICYVRGVAGFELVSVEGVPVVLCERPDVVILGPIANGGKFGEKLPLQLLGVVDGLAGDEVCRDSVDNGG